MEELFARYAAGDEEVMAPLCALLMVAVSDAMRGRLRYKRNRDDLLGEAFLEIVIAVKRAKAEALNPQWIAGYVVNSVKYAIRKADKRDHLIVVPPTTFDRGVEPPKAVAIAGDPPSSATPEERARYYPVAARPETPSTDFMELLARAVKTQQEELIVSLRAAEMSYLEVGDAIGVSNTHVMNVLHRIEGRYRRLSESEPRCKPKKRE
jgi:DNA-directed RNA polymerase specialized sigma24 family protein